MDMSRDLQLHLDLHLDLNLHPWRPSPEHTAVARPAGKEAHTTQQRERLI